MCTTCNDAAGCTVKAVRFYEASGLLPRAARSPSGYRLYSELDVRRLAFIQRAKLMGLPLAKIRDLVVHLSETKCACPKIRPHLEQLIREQLQALFPDRFAGADLTTQGLAFRIDGRPAPAVVYNLRSPEEVITPSLSEGASLDGWPILQDRQLLFRQTPVTWEECVHSWQTGDLRNGSHLLAKEIAVFPTAPAV